MDSWMGNSEARTVHAPNSIIMALWDVEGMADSRPFEAHRQYIEGHAG